MSALPVELHPDTTPPALEPVPRLLLTVEETCEALGTNRSVLYTDVLPYVETMRLGRRRYVLVASLREFVADRGAAS